jgi:hypothetical protein
MSTVCSPFSGRLITLNFLSVLIVFCCCFTWMAVGDVALQFSLKLVRKPTLSKRKLNEQLDYISHRR